MLNEICFNACLLSLMNLIQEFYFSSFLSCGVAARLFAAFEKCFLANEVKKLLMMNEMTH